MAVQLTYPGVYIEEFTPGAPIEGVGTSTPAFIGIAARGELNLPTKITSWDQFVATFGEQPVPGFFLWYAVRGFFENGGTVCYVVRASNGAYAGLGLETPPTTALQDRVGNQMLRVRTRQPGVPTPAIEVHVKGVNLLSANLYQPTGNYTVLASREIELSDAKEAAQFRPGDWVNLGTGNERLQILHVSGARLRLASDFIGAAASPPTMRLADAPVGTRVVRIEPTTPVPSGTLVAGAMLTVNQGGIQDSQIVETVQAEPLATTPPITTYRVTFRHGLDIPLSLTNSATIESEEFEFRVSQGGASTSYDNLSLDPAHPRYFLKTINEDDGLVQLELIEPPPPVSPPNNLPKNTLPAGSPVAGGRLETLATIDNQVFINALDTLQEIDDVNLIAIPDCLMLEPPLGTPQVVQQAVIAHCEQMGDRFAVLDAQPGLPLFGATSIETQRLGLDSIGGRAALYYPWLHGRPNGPGPLILIPPSGHVCGIIARTDNTRGVHKAPANEIVNGALGVERTMSDIDQGQLNIQGINVIRQFRTGGRPILWGARTTAPKENTNWRYVSTRRLFLFVEESIQEGIRWAVFEPNNPGLWAKLRLAISEFLTRVWHDGALFGATAKEAFYVRIDETLNPDSVRALGRLYIEIGLRPSYPAEFIIMRIGIWQGGTEVVEA